MKYISEKDFPTNEKDLAIYYQSYYLRIPLFSPKKKAFIKREEMHRRNNN
jgi:hypothetical protein